MREVAAMLNEMLSAGVIQNYALFGATAQMRYTEPVVTLDVDVLVDVPDASRLDPLASVYAFCAAKGYRPEGAAIHVGAWPVQFLPAFDPLTREAMEQAETADLEGVPLRVVGANHLAVIALSAGRAKDYERVLALIESRATSRQQIEALAGQHGLTAAWKRFAKRFLDG